MNKFTSIQTRLLIAVLSMTTAIVGCFAAFSFWQVNAGLKESLQSEALVMVSPFYKSLARELPEDADNLYLFVRVQIAAKGASMFPELVRVHAELQGVLFLEADGNALRQAGKIKDLSKQFYQSILNGVATFEKTDAETVFVSIPFYHEKQNLGSTVLFFSTERIAAQDRRIMRAALFVFLFFLVIGCFGAVAVARSITGPIVNLAEKIGEGKISDIDLEMTREDEVGVFSRSFAQMREAIQKQMGELNAEIAIRERAEKELREAFDRSFLQQEAISQLSVENTLRLADFKAAASTITMKTAEVLAVHRVSLWLLEERETVLRCLDVYDSSTALHTSEDKLAVEDFPVYFAEMIKKEPVAINDVFSDSRSMELVDNYFRPHGIMSTIDTGFYVDGTIIGTICCESRDVKRHWKPDEIVFISRIADQASIALTTSKRIKAEAALQRSEEDLRITLNSIADAVIATDIDGKVVRMNPVAERLTGWSFVEACGKQLREVFHIINGTTRDRIESPVERVLATGQIVELANHTVLICRDDTEYQIADSGAPIRTDDGKAIGVVLVFRDVTHDYAIQKQLQQSQKMDAIGQLAGGVAHDFNNMLGGIVGATELLRQYLIEDPQAKKLHEMILTASDRAADLTQKLLTFAKKGPVDNVLLDIHKTINDTAALLESTLDRLIELELDLLATESHMLGDSSQLQNAILNLAINASHAMPEGGTIVIATRTLMIDSIYCKASTFDLTTGPHIEIEIRDTGCGIEPDVLPHIFEPFYSTKAPGKGTGLGLSAAFGTVQHHHGAISVYSEPGSGTCFHLTLPLAIREKAGHLFEAPEHPISGQGRILVVDDEAVVRQTAQMILEELGYEVIVAENGQQAVDLFKQYSQYSQDSIDLVILDMVMPEMNGRDCFATLREISPEVRVVLSSGFSLEEEIKQLQSDGLKGCIRKPYRSVALSQVVSKAITS